MNIHLHTEHRKQENLTPQHKDLKKKKKIWIKENYKISNRRNKLKVRKLTAYSRIGKLLRFMKRNSSSCSAASLKHEMAAIHTHVYNRRETARRRRRRRTVVKNLETDKLRDGCRDASAEIDAIINEK